MSKFISNGSMVFKSSHELGDSGRLLRETGSVVRKTTSHPGPVLTVPQGQAAGGHEMQFRSVPWPHKFWKPLQHACYFTWPQMYLISFNDKLTWVLESFQMISSSVRHDFLLILSELNHVTQLQERTTGGWTIGPCKTSNNNGLLVCVSLKHLRQKAT